MTDAPLATSRLGATCAPFVATLFVEHQPRRFYFHYLVSVAICAVNTLLLIAVFRLKTHEGIFGRDMTETKERSSSQKFKKLLSMRRTYLMGAFLLLYVGAEVTIGGWIVGPGRIMRCFPFLTLSAAVQGHIHSRIPRGRNLVRLYRHRILGR